MVFVLKMNKIIIILIVCSFLNISIQPVWAYDFMVLPPILDEEEDWNDKHLPDFSNEINNEINNTEVENKVSTSTPLKGTVSTIPVGTTFQIITNENINSQRNKVGETFSTALSHPISVDGNIIIPAGSEVIGQITYTEDSRRAGKNAKMEIKFTHIRLPNGPRIPIVGKIMTQDNTGVLKGGTVKNQLVSGVKQEAIATAGGALIGTGIGAIAGSAGAGMAVGATGGGVLGLGWLIWRKGKPVKIDSGTKMVVVLEQPFNIVK